jgi:hypothetical protein
MEPDFSGWATKAGLKCSDGRTIMPEAFQHQDKVTVPLVWQHGHNSAENVLGHAILENRPGEGVYTYGFFNSTPQGVNAKTLVQHKDIDRLSIYANQLVEKSKQVFHGMIREVSLVLSGANPGAMIDYVAVQHSDGSIDTIEDEAVIYTDIPLTHALGAAPAAPPAEAVDSDRTIQDVFAELTPEQLHVVEFIVGAIAEEMLEDGGEGGEGMAQSALGPDATVQDVYDSMTDQQQQVVNYMIGAALDAANGGDLQQSSLSHQEGTSMSRNVFEGSATASAPRQTLSHAQTASIFETAKKTGSLKQAVLQHAQEYGVDNIDLLFPNPQLLENTPQFITRRMEWVSTVMNGIRKAPFARIKSPVGGSSPADEARAKGYVKGNLKKEEMVRAAAAGHDPDDDLQEAEARP